jgi:hypothetical protein
MPNWECCIFVDISTKLIFILFLSQYMTQHSLESIEPQKQCKQTMICELSTMQKDICVLHHLLFLPLMIQLFFDH